MIREIKDINEYLNWIDDYIYDQSFSTPFCDKERIIRASKKQENVLFGSYKEDKITGIFCLMVLDDEKTIETIYMYSKDSDAYEEIMEYLSKKYNDYEVWFVFNPNNYILKNLLLNRNAFFYTEQRYMEYHGTKPSDADEIIPYCEDYRDAYINIHSKDGYWNGEKVLEQIDRFDIFLCIRENKLAGYIDLSKGDEQIEIMDILVTPEYRNQGVGALLLRKAINHVYGRQLILTVDVDNNPAIHLYEKLGFKDIPLNNCMTAKL